MTAVAKQAYYRDLRMPASLQAFYFREVEGARRILDLGCGTGGLGRHPHSPDIEIFGVDIDLGALRVAARFETVTCLDLESEPLPHEDASFDAVLAKDSFERVQDPGRLAPRSPGYSGRVASS
jgi:SAM-dependent methyltransferase